MTGDRSADSVWLEVSDGLLRGLGHSLNNRLAALAALTQLADGAGGMEMAAFRDALDSEAGRLERVIQLLRLLPSGRAPYPVRIEEVLPQVLDLHRVHSEFPETEYEPFCADDVLPMRVEPSLLTRALLVFLTVAVRRVRAEGGTRVLLHCGGDERYTSVTARCGGVRPSEGSPEERAEGAYLEATVELLARGGLEGAAVADEGADLVLRLPTLLETRRREREARSTSSADGPGSS